MTTKFEEALEKAAENYAIKYKYDLPPVVVCYTEGAHFAQSFYLPLLREAMAAYDKSQDHVQRLEQRIEKLRKALSYYSRPELDFDLAGFEESMMEDCGDIARKTLADDEAAK